MIMIDDFSKISELKSINERKSKLTREEQALSTPLLTNLEHIPEIYQCFCKEYSCCGALRKETDTQFKREFLFIILFIYSPGTLAGSKKIANGVRNAVAQVFGFHSPSGVSNLCLSVADWYERYKDFRDNIHCLYGIIKTVYVIIKSRLKAEGLIE